MIKLKCDRCFLNGSDTEDMKLKCPLGLYSFVQFEILPTESRLTKASWICFFGWECVLIQLER